MANKIKLNPKQEKHPKEGPRSYQAGDKEKFDFGYGSIDWSVKFGYSSNERSVQSTKKDPNEPVCPGCKGDGPSGTCPGCL